MNTLLIRGNKKVYLYCFTVILININERLER